MRTKNILIISIIFLFIIILPSKLNAVTIVLDAGHGGHDSGAVSNNIYEKTINLKVTQYLKQYLEEYENVEIIMTRDDDTFLEIYDRSMVARNNNADLMISLHFNSALTSTTDGAEVYVSNNKSLDKYNKETTILGNKILNELEKIGISNRGVKTRLIPTDETDIYTDGTRADYYGIIRYAMRGCKIDSGVIKPAGALPAKVEEGEGIPAIIIEHCYMNNSVDQAFLNSEESLQKIARADANGIVEYYKLSKKVNVKCKISQDFLIAEPDITIDDIKQRYESATISIDTALVTGCILTIEEKEYKLIKLGDCNGDGQISPADYVKIKNHIMNVSTLIDGNEIAADVNEDGQISPADYVKVKNHIMNVSTIKIKLEEEQK